jgi:hypothetical protein
MELRRLAPYAVATACGLFVLRLLGASWETGFDPVFPDSFAYLQVAERGPLRPSFWLDERPPAYPMVLWWFGRSARTVVLFQSFAYVAAWLWLAVVAWRQLQVRWVAGAVVAIFALLALQGRWAFWNTLILTESLSISAGVAAMAAWWMLVAEPTRPRQIAAVAVTAAWMLLRDSNALWFTAVLVPALACAWILHRRRPTQLSRRAVMTMAILIGVGGYSAVALAVTDRSDAPFHNNVGLRWLPDTDMTAFMVDRGLPLDDALEARRGGDAWADGEAFLSDPALAEYREWAKRRGRIAMAVSLVTKAPWWLDRFVDDLEQLVPADLSGYDLHEVHERLPHGPVGSIDPLNSRRTLVVVSALAVVGIAVAGRRRLALGCLGALVFVPAWIDVYLSYVGDGVEVARHVTVPLLRVATASLVAIALGTDALIVHQRRRNDSPDADEPEAHSDTRGAENAEPVP